MSRHACSAASARPTGSCGRATQAWRWRVPRRECWAHCQGAQHRHRPASSCEGRAPRAPRGAPFGRSPCAPEPSAGSARACPSRRSSTVTPNASASLRDVWTEPVLRSASMSATWTRWTPDARARADCDSPRCSRQSRAGGAPSISLPATSPGEPGTMTNPSRFAETSFDVVFARFRGRLRDLEGRWPSGGAFAQAIHPPPRAVSGPRFRRVRVFPRRRGDHRCRVGRQLRPATVRR